MKPGNHQRMLKGATSCREATLWEISPFILTNSPVSFLLSSQAGSFSFF